MFTLSGRRERDEAVLTSVNQASLHLPLHGLPAAAAFSRGRTRCGIKSAAQTLDANRILRVASETPVAEHFGRPKTCLCSRLPHLSRRCGSERVLAETIKLLTDQGQ